VALHLALTAVAVWLGAAFVVWFGEVSDRYAANASYYSGHGQTGVFGVFIFVYGATIGTLAFATYLWLCAHLLRGAPHMNEVFSVRRYKDLKHFLRFHVQSDGRIHAYVIGVDRVARKWDLADPPPGWGAAVALGARPFGAVYKPRPEPRCRVVDAFSLD
jgi:hypothetical protein